MTGATATTARARRLLHRHVGLHRLQGVRGRVQGVEPRPGGRLRLDRPSRTTTPSRARREHLAARQVRRAGASRCARRRRGVDGRCAGSWSRTSASTARTPAASTSARPARSSAPSSAPSSCSRTSATAAATASPPAPSACSTSGTSPPTRTARQARLPLARHEGGRPRLEVHALLRPAEGRPRAGVREGVPDAVDPVRAARRAARARRRAAREAAGRGLERRPALRPRPGRRRRRLRRVLPPARRPRGVRAAPGPDRDDEAPRRMWKNMAVAAAALAVGVAGAFARRPVVNVTATARVSYYGRPVIKEPTWTPGDPVVLLHRRALRRVVGALALGEALRERAACADGALHRRGGRRRLARCSSSPTSAGRSASTTCCACSR